MNTYITVSGDTFDKIAYVLLGSEYLFPMILEENQKYRDVLVFSSGIVLNIPDVELDEYEDLPEWMADDDETDDLGDEEAPAVADEVDS